VLAGIVEKHRCGFRSCLHHGLQGALLKVSLAFHDIDQIGNQIGTALVLAEHFRPAGLDLLVAPLKLVVATTGQAAGDGHKENLDPSVKC
jgi:hypothetical protein